MIKYKLKGFECPVGISMYSNWIDCQTGYACDGCPYNQEHGEPNINKMDKIIGELLNDKL